MAELTNDLRWLEALADQPGAVSNYVLLPDLGVDSTYNCQCVREVLRSIIARLRASEPSTIPCCKCGGEVVEFSIANADWNTIIRNDGPETDKEYLCLNCFGAIAAQRLRATEKARAILESVQFSSDPGDYVNANSCALAALETGVGGG